jgi:hypothetical protein
MKLLSHKVSVICNAFLTSLSKTLYTNVANHVNFVPVLCHPQNGVHVVQPLQDQTGGSRRVADVSRKQGRKNTPSHFCDGGVRPGIVVKEKDVFSVSVRVNSTDALSQFSSISEFSF